jgi:hypothetical protein
MSYLDCSDVEGLDLGDRDDYELCGLCGEVPVDVPDSLCASCKRFDAAHSGEGDDMQDIDRMMSDTETTFDMQLRLLLEDANTLQLKQVRYSLEREEKKRLEDAQATIRALDPKAPKPRATRKDAGRPRAAKAANDVPRDEKGMAV